MSRRSKKRPFAKRIRGNPARRRRAGRGNRRSIRLHGYDYSTPGAYFITIVTHRRRHLFGHIVNGEMRLNEWGRIARAEWLKTPAIRPEIELDEYQIMPNHMHAIIHIVEQDNGFVGAIRRVAPTTTLPAGSIGAIIGQYKSITSKRINRTRRTPGAPIWQRNYHDHIIRDERELARIRKYIRNNPLRWDMDP
jgi:putative transposase